MDLVNSEMMGSYHFDLLAAVMSSEARDSSPLQSGYLGPASQLVSVW